VSISHVSVKQRHIEVFCSQRIRSLYMETGLGESAAMKAVLTAVVVLGLGAILTAGHLGAETESEAPSVSDPVPSPPAGIIVTPPVSIPARPESVPPVSSPPQTCPATDRRLDLIG
jgi:hypothetical protein